MGNAPRASSRSLSMNPTDEHPKAAHQKSSKSVETSTLRTRSENSKTEHGHRHIVSRGAPTLDPIQPGGGKSKQSGETILMPLVCLLSIQVAQRTHPEVFAAAKRIVLKLIINQSQVQGFVRITPVGFNMKTNLVGSAAAFLPRATKYLQDWETILGPGVIDQLAQRYSIPDLGDQIYELLGTTQVFKRRKEEEDNVTRDMGTFPRVKCAPQPSANLLVSPLSDSSPGIPGPPSLLQPQHPQTPQRNWPDGRPQQGDRTITYAQALMNSSQTHMSSMVPPCAPTHDTPSPTISSLSGASSSTAARSAILEMIRNPIGSRTSPQTIKSDGPSPVWQTAIANTMQMVTELLSHLRKPPRHNRRSHRPTNESSSSSRSTKIEENPQEPQGNSVKWRSGRKPQDRWRGRRGPRDERPKQHRNQEQHNISAPRGSVAPPTGRGPPTQSGNNTLILENPEDLARRSAMRAMTATATQTLLRSPTTVSRGSKHQSNDELELLQLQDEVDEENWVGTGTGMDETPSYSTYARHLIASTAEEDHEELPQEDTLIMSLGPAKPAPVIATPCSCDSPGDCCLEERMLALQDILEDEKAMGPDAIAYATSANAEITREIRYTASLIARFDKERELKVRAHKAAIKKVWWIPYHKRPDHPNPYHRNSPLPTPIPGPMELNPEMPLFQPAQVQERANSRKRAREACTCPVCTNRKTHRTVKTQTYESMIHRRRRDSKRHTACLFRTHGQIQENLPDTFVCCNIPKTQDKLLQVHRPHLGAHRLAIVHTPHDTQDPRVAVVFPLAIIRGQHGPPPVRWSELSLALVPAGTPADLEYTVQCYDCTRNPDCPHVTAFQRVDDLESTTHSPNMSPKQHYEAVGRGPKKQEKLRSEAGLSQINQNLVAPTANDFHLTDTPYTLHIEHTQIQYDMYLTPHALRGQVLQTKGFPDFKSATRKDMVDMVISTSRTIRAIMGSPRYQREPTSFTLNRTMHQHGAAIKIHNDYLLLMSMGQDRVVTYTYFYALGSRISINERIFSTREFWSFLDANYKPPRTAIVRPIAVPQQATRMFAKPNLDNLLDFNLLFSSDDLDYIRNFDMDNIGKYKISTVKNIKAKDVHLYRQILASAYKGIVESSARNDQQNLLLACRFLFLLPTILLRKPDSAVPQRLDAFLAGDLRLCTRGLLTVHDNYINKGDRAPHNTRHRLAAARVFDGQYAKAVQVLTHTDSSTTYEQRREAMECKQPKRTAEDDIHIKVLPPSLPSPPLDERTIYDTLRKSTRRGIAPGPNGDRFEYLQSVIFDPYKNPEAATTLHLLTKFANLDKEGSLPSEWYEYIIPSRP